MSDTDLYIPALVNRNKWNDYRDEIWGDSYNWSWNRRPDEVKYLVIHHTVTTHDATPDDIALLHKARGWAGIGYHFLIDKAGIVYYVGDVGTARANVLDMNEKVIGISLIGDFTKFLPSDDQILSAHDLCAWFLEQKAIWPAFTSWEANVVGHKELQATQCPGNDWKETASSLFNRIKGRIPYTPAPPAPEPTPTPGPVTPPTPTPEPVPSPEPIPQPSPGPTPLKVCETNLTEVQEQLKLAQGRDYTRQSNGTLFSQIIANITGNNPAYPKGKP